MNPSPSDGSRIRPGAERYLLLMIVAYVVAVVATRWYLQLTGYPQVGGGDLHVAHALWGGLLLLVAAMVPLLYSGGRALVVGSVCAGVGAGLFIDEIGKFITKTNDYFYPLAAPLIYGMLLALVLVFLVVARRAGEDPPVVAPVVVADWEATHVRRRRYRRLLALWLLLLGIGWALTLVVYASIDEDTMTRLVSSLPTSTGDRVERPDQPFFLLLEALIMGVAGFLLVAAAIALLRGRDATGTKIALVGLVVALTAGAIVSLYVDQVSAIGSTIVHALALGAVVRYRQRFVTGEPLEPLPADQQVAAGRSTAG